MKKNETTSNGDEVQFLLRERSSSEDRSSGFEMLRTDEQASRRLRALSECLRKSTSFRKDVGSPVALFRSKSAPDSRVSKVSEDFLSMRLFPDAKEKYSKLCLSEAEINANDALAPKLPVEEEKGNVEYKLQLLDPTPQRLDHLVTQMQWRLLEGHSEAIYEIGVEDSGHPKGVLPLVLNRSLYTLSQMAARLGATAKILHVRRGAASSLHRVAEVSIRQQCTSDVLLELRIAVIGGVSSGKSTLIGVLTKGTLDNGRGGARIVVLRHQHELENGGTTSAISHRVLGFNSKGEVTNYSNLRSKKNNEIVRESAKILTFLDLAGHERFLRTTAFGLTGTSPDYALLVVAADSGVGRMTKEHLGIALALKLPVVVVVTKIDMVPRSTVDKQCRVLSRIFASAGGKRSARIVETVSDLSSLVRDEGNLGTEVVPIFPVSNVTGGGLDLLRRCLNILPVRQDYERAKARPTEFRIFDTFNVDGVGTVVAGTVSAGKIKISDQLLLGPDGVTGQFFVAEIKSIHTKQVPVAQVSAGQSATMAIRLLEEDIAICDSKTDASLVVGGEYDGGDGDGVAEESTKSSSEGDVRSKISSPMSGGGSTSSRAVPATPFRRSLLRKGIVLVDPSLKPHAIREFDIDLLLLYHPSGICCNHQLFAHAETVCQSVQIVSMDARRMRTGHRAKCRMRLMYHAEYLHEGSTVFFRDGRGKGIGTILRLHSMAEIDAAEGGGINISRSNIDRRSEVVPDAEDVSRVPRPINERTARRRRERHTSLVALKLERKVSNDMTLDANTVEGQARGMPTEEDPTPPARGE